MKIKVSASELYNISKKSGYKSSFIMDMFDVEIVGKSELTKTDLRELSKLVKAKCDEFWRAGWPS